MELSRVAGSIGFTVKMARIRDLRGEKKPCKYEWINLTGVKEVKY